MVWGANRHSVAVLVIGRAWLARMFVLGALNWAPQWFDPDRGPLDDVIGTTQRFILHALTRGVPDDLRDAVGAQAPAGLDAT